MESGPGQGEGGEARALRREAHTALSGRVPEVLAVAVALLSGCVLGYGWRALLGASEAAACPVRMAAPAPLVPVDPPVSGPPPRLLFIEEKPLAPPCPRR
jgi:hypothetical protein